MDILPCIFRSCKICGIWYEDSSYLLLKIVYSGLTGIVIVHFLLSESIELMIAHNSLNEASEMIFATFNFISCCFKVLNIVSRRNALRNLLQDFRLPICQSRSPEEMEIIEWHKGFLSKVFLGYSSLALSTGLIMSSVPLLGNEARMPYKAYQFFDTSGPISFGVAVSLQFIAVLYVILISVTMDSMAVGFMILATGQMEINCHRIVNSTMSLKACIEHQILMCRTILKVQNLFMPVVVPQFFFSLATLCTSVFLMTQMPVTDAGFVPFGMCFASMLVQVFAYCWFGNELNQKIQYLADAAYNSNWVDSDKKGRKNLWYVMIHAKQATTISFHGQCGLTLHTFIWIVKTSYAVFNLLRRATN